ncbi:CDP-diacylglycerol--serine O-phosphatidyltransferase [Rufibacter sp. LB8]|uniref:CDP-diacylglycerol--serine O-phosphatidyltransferase n=1 Tax=Rufibacter sp. LB8 TaxID=2777781 RepID=UPI00178C2B0F|nr:CDP-diacylglycerol--serine O-phosphatidyltransferase [Rufibacter sp. LB8]
MKRHIPNFITCLNLLCGCIAIYYVFQQELVNAAYLVILAAILDFMDGMVARVLHAYSEIGKQLDSLADMVSFGVVPGVMMFHLLSRSVELSDFGPTTAIVLPFMGFLMTIFSALRLAKFNIDTRQTTSFIGVPTPANTLFVISMPLILANDTFGLAPYILNPFVLLVITVVFSYLLVAELPLFALKFKSFKWQGNQIRFIFLGLSVALLALLNVTAIPVIIVLYILLSFLKPSTL